MPKGLHTHPGQLRVKGGYDDAGNPFVRWAAGSMVAPGAAQEVLDYFVEDRYNILHTPMFSHSFANEEPQRAFIRELADRGYDLETLDFSVYVENGGFVAPRRLGYGRQVPGVLYSRYARLEHEGLDVCCFWRRPCQKADVNLWFNLLSVPTCTKSRLLALGDKALNDRGLRDALLRLGFDERTLRMRVKSNHPVHPDDLARKVP